MKFSTLSAAVLLAVSTASTVYAAEPVKPVPPRTVDDWAMTMWDFTRNAEVLKDPKQFVPFLTAATEPGFYTTLGYQMLDPAMWGFMANTMMNPASYSAWMPLVTDPLVYTKWLTASLDPNFYTAVLAQFSDVGKMMRWLMYPVDPKLWGLMLQTMNPAVYAKWMLAPLDPRWVQAMLAPVNPNLYMGWLAATMNPASYGEMWKGLLTYPTGTTPPAATPAPALGAAPATNPWVGTAYGGGGTTFNFFDPTTWGQYVPAPAPPQAAPGTTPQYFNPFDPNSWSRILSVPYAPATQPAPATR